MFGEDNLLDRLYHQPALDRERREPPILVSHPPGFPKKDSQSVIAVSPKVFVGGRLTSQPPSYFVSQKVRDTAMLPLFVNNARMTLTAGT